MIYLGSYKLDNYKNILSIPEFISVEQKKNNGLVYVISDTLFSYEASFALIEKTKRTFNSIIKQNGIFNNIEAIVLNGNIVNNAYNPQYQNSNFVNNIDFVYSFLRTLIKISKNIPVYYVRGAFDCYISTQMMPPELRGIIKFCNGLKIGNTIFIHGHSSLPFITNGNYELINDSFRKSKQEMIGQDISNSLNANVVLSNSMYETYKKDNFISIGSFEEYGVSVLSLEPLSIVKL